MCPGKIEKSWECWLGFAGAGGERRSQWTVLGERNSGRSTWTEKACQNPRNAESCWTATEIREKLKFEEFFILFFFFPKAGKNKGYCRRLALSLTPRKKLDLGQKASHQTPGHVLIMPVKGLALSGCTVGPSWIWILVWIGEWAQLRLSMWHFLPPLPPILLW